MTFFAAKYGESVYSEQKEDLELKKKCRKAKWLSEDALQRYFTEYIMQNAWLDESKAGVKIAGRNINNLRYADDITLMAESEEELKSILMKVKEECEKA